jgi:hypothetical protein
MSVKITRSSCSNQKMSAVMSGLMGIVFGCSIVYIISRLVAAQRRIAALETHIGRKADDDVVVSLSSKLNEMSKETKVELTNLMKEVKRSLDESQPIPDEGKEEVKVETKEE